MARLPCKWDCNLALVGHQRLRLMAPNRPAHPLHYYHKRCGSPLAPFAVARVGSPGATIRLVAMSFDGQHANAPTTPMATRHAKTGARRRVIACLSHDEAREVATKIADDVRMALPLIRDLILSRCACAHRDRDRRRHGRRHRAGSLGLSLARLPERVPTLSKPLRSATRQRETISPSLTRTATRPSLSPHTQSISSRDRLPFL